MHMDMYMYITLCKILHPNLSHLIPFYYRCCQDIFCQLQQYEETESIWKIFQKVFAAEAKKPSNAGVLNYFVLGFSPQLDMHICILVHANFGEH